MKFLIEIVVLVVLFVLFRKGVKAAFPVKSLDMDLSEDSLKAIKKFNARHRWLFWGVGLTFTALFFVLIRWLFILFHYRGNYDMVYIIENTSLLLPALVLGFLVARYLAGWLNEKLQRDGYGFFLAGKAQESTGYDHDKFAKWHLVLALLLSAILLYGQYQVEFRVQGDEISYSYEMGNIRRFKVSEVSNHYVKDEKLFLIMKNDTLATDKFEFDNQTFLEYLAQQR